MRKILETLYHFGLFTTKNEKLNVNTGYKSHLD